MDELDTKPCVLLQAGLDIKQLASGMVCFETDTEFLTAIENTGEPDEDANEIADYFAFEEQKYWIGKSFKKLWEQMPPVGNGSLIRKDIIRKGDGLSIKENTVLKVNFSAFCEDAIEPFACTEENHSKVIQVDDGAQLPGLDMALKTMNVGEYSRFLISHELMYGDLGCPPLIPQKAICLFNIAVVTSLPAIEKKDNIEDENRSCFRLVYEKAVVYHLSGKVFFEKTEHNYAVKSFRSAVRLLENCRLANEEEEAKQQKFLGKLYLNLAICYNKLNMPLKACTACNELNHIGKLWNNSKALLHNARALMEINKYDEAEKKIRAGLRINTTCQALKDEFAILLKKQSMASVVEDNLGKTVGELKAIEPKKTAEEVNDDFIDSAEEFCRAILNNENAVKVELPGGLSGKELDAIKNIAKKHNLFCELEDSVIKYISKVKLN